MRYIIVDLEATCWENVRDFERMETIEIGAVELPAGNSEPTREFSRFIRPVAEPELSVFCQRLTTIRQRDVDRAEYVGGADAIAVAATTCAGLQALLAQEIGLKEAVQAGLVP